MLHITNDHLNKWEKDGYIKIENFFSNETIKKVSNYVDDITAWHDVDDKWMKWYEVGKNNNKMVCRVENFLDYHPQIKHSLLIESKMESILEKLLSEKVVLLKEKINIKAPYGSGFVPHQDIYDSNPREVDTVVMVAVDPATELNGCLKVYGNYEYKKGIIGTGKNGRISPDIYKKYKWESMECNPGDIVIFDSYVPHYSEPNASENSRRAIFISFKKTTTPGFSREEYYQNKRIQYPPEKANANIKNLKPSSTTIYGIKDPKI